MKTLELKHLQNYLSSKLKCHCMGEFTKESEYTDNQIPEVLEVTSLNDTYVDVNDGFCQFEYFEVTPILHPLSDLIKPILPDGKIPIDELFIMYGGGVSPKGKKSWKTSMYENVLYSPADTLSHGLIKHLHEWHFAVDLPEGSWIDVNSLPENPYTK